MHSLNLGILAHIDAGKTSLTERLLYAAGVIDEIGSVDRGSTTTDTLALEKQRGITIKSAVVAFTLPGGGAPDGGPGGPDVNLIDAPGHPDFIAEVERVLGVLDGAVLVVSAVEGVQPQTRVLMRTLRRLRIPTLIFVNKLDRRGADLDRTLRAVAGRLTPDIVAMTGARAQGTPQAAAPPYTAADPGFDARLLDLLARRDDRLLAAYVRDEHAVDHARLRAALAEQTAAALVHPVYAGSAVTGAGTSALIAGIAALLPARRPDPDAPVRGTIFKMERGPAGERIAYVRVAAGTVRTRDRLPVHRGGGPVGEGRVTALSVFEAGTDTRRDHAPAGRIARVWGLGDVRIGDTVGAPPPAAGEDRHFAPPSLETVVTARRPADRGALHAALVQLAEQDPLIDLRRDELRQEIAVSLYGEVQKEVIQATLAGEFGLDADFRPTTTLHIERPAGTGAAVESIAKDGNPFLATVGLRVAPGPAGSGVAFGLGVELGAMPYAFFAAVEETVRRTLEQGLHGWRVTDCAVTMTHCGYWPRQSHAHGTFDKSMSSTGADFRGLTPLVLMAALRQAGTTVHEPMHRFRLDLPADALGTVLPVLARLGALPRTPAAHDGGYELAGDIPAARVHDLERRLPTLTRGEGALESAFHHYRPVTGKAPERPRTDHNPLDREEYLLRVLRRVPGAGGNGGRAGGGDG
ncbi:translation factor GTPase family protein [Streptomyces sp. CA2R106]|uniref:translation factor GTPase family protein n=1 Tax=Streptomyces sp. CA2R106 TaxID=3120153 RepID=UPI00300AD08A